MPQLHLQSALSPLQWTQFHHNLNPICYSKSKFTTLLKKSMITTWYPTLHQECIRQLSTGRGLNYQIKAIFNTYCLTIEEITHQLGEIIQCGTTILALLLSILHFPFQQQPTSTNHQPWPPGALIFQHPTRAPIHPVFTCPHNTLSTVTNKTSSFWIHNCVPAETNKIMNEHNCSRCDKVFDGISHLNDH